MSKPPIPDLDQVSESQTSKLQWVGGCEQAVMGHLKELEHKAIVNPAVGKQTHAYPCQNWKSSLFFKGLQVADAPVHSGTPPV